MTTCTQRVTGRIAVSALKTPFGAFLLATREETVFCTSGPRPEVLDPIEWGRWRWPGGEIVRGGRGHRDLIAQLREYFAGRRRVFDLPMAFEGNELHIRAWLAATAIPYGRTLTYGDLAWEIGAPGAARAVGRAMSLCELPVLVPCHRVVGSGGRRCGSLEAWERREQLLEFERVHSAERSRSRGGRLTCGAPIR